MKFVEGSLNLFMAMCHFVPSHIGLLENIDSVRDAVLLDSDPLHFVRQKVTLDLVRVVFKYWSLPCLQWTVERYPCSEFDLNLQFFVFWVFFSVVYKILGLVVVFSSIFVIILFSDPSSHSLV